MEVIKTKLNRFSLIQDLMKYGKAIKTMPIKMIRNIFETKYVKQHKATPENMATNRLCFFPYIKYPAPIAPNKTLHIICVELPIIFFYLLGKSVVSSLFLSFDFW